MRRLLGILSIAILGCGGEAEVAKPKTPPAAPAPAPAPAGAPSPTEQDATAATPPADPAPAEPQPTPSPPTVPPPAVATRPDELVTQVAQALVQRQPHILWYALPDSYQNELFLLIAEPARKADPELWNGVFELLKEASAALKAKKEAFLSYHALPTLGLDPEQARLYYDPTVAVLSILAESKLNQQADAATINLGDFLAVSGARILDEGSALATSMLGLDIHAELNGLKAHLLEENGDAARVSLEIPGRASEEVDFVRVEGKWLPRALVDQWPSLLERARTFVNQLPVRAEDEKKKERQKFVITTVKGFLTGFQKAEDDKSIHKSLDLILQFTGYNVPKEGEIDPDSINLDELERAVGLPVNPPTAPAVEEESATPPGTETNTGAASNPSTSSGAEPPPVTP